MQIIVYKSFTEDTRSVTRSTDTMLLLPVVSRTVGLLVSDFLLLINYLVTLFCSLHDILVLLSIVNITRSVTIIREIYK